MQDRPVPYGVAPGSQAEQVGRLILAVALVLFIPSLPFGNYLMYPFVILTTWFHEMGHGLMAMALGQGFDRLMIYADGSGVAQHSVNADASVFTHALIAAGGPLGPVLAGSGLIIASAHPKAWRPTLWAVSVAILASTIIFVRSPVGYAVLPVVGAALGLAAWKAPQGLVRFLLQFLGMLGATSMLADFRYLFTENISLGGKPMLSDTGAIEAALWLPHWIWASVILLVSTVIVGASLKYALSDKRRIPPPKKKLPANVLQFKRK